MRTVAHHLLAFAAVMCVLSSAGRSNAETTAPPADMTTETFRNWVLRCISSSEEEAKDHERLCEVTQELNDSKSSSRVLAIGLQKAAEDGDAGGALVTIVAPLGVSLSHGVTITGETGQQLKIPFDICLPAGCVARGTLSSQEVGELSKSTSVEVGLMAPDGNSIVLKVLPDGLADAWRRLLEL